MKAFNQTYGIGLKEIWEVKNQENNIGRIIHTMGWPLHNHGLYGGGFVYNIEKNLVHLGLVVAMKWSDGNFSPYETFQKWKTHPSIKSTIEGGECISYGARALNEGGFHSIPRVTFPGGLLVGCSAGFMNNIKVKGAHNAIRTGYIAADSIYDEAIKESNNLENLCGKEITP